MISVSVRLPLCVSILGSVVSANQFSSHVVRCLLLCFSITGYPASVFVLACQPNYVLVENADAGVDAYETPLCGCFKGVTKAKSECKHFPLTLTETHIWSPSLTLRVFCRVLLPSLIKSREVFWFLKI